MSYGGHDSACEDTFAELACNCHVRALEAKLVFRDSQLKAIAEHCDSMYPMPDGRRADDGQRPIEQHVGMVLHTLTSRLAALRPLVRAAVEWAEASGSAPLLKAVLARNNAIDAARDLTPEQVAWAKGGE